MCNMYYVCIHYDQDRGSAIPDFDDTIVGEVVYDEEYTRHRKQKRKMSSSSEGEEEYNWDDENADDEEEEDDNLLSMSEDSDEPRITKKLPGRPSTRRKSKSVNELQSGLRRSRRATRNHINYKQYEMSDSEADSSKREKLNASNEQSDTDHEEFLDESLDPDDDKENEEKEIVDKPIEEILETMEEKVQNHLPGKSNSSGQDEIVGVKKRRFLDLNELAPVSGFDDGPDAEMKDEDTDKL